LQQAVRGILNDDWDPIPGTPDDEYDEVVRKILPMIKAAESAAAIAAVLQAFEVDIGVDRVDSEMCAEVALRLARLSQT
jgi:hypothetical protein